MIFSYTRVSTDRDQTVANQDLQISNAGFTIDKAFEDVGVSGSISPFDRPSFKRMLADMKPLDTCVCISIDRLGRSALDVLSVVEYFKEKNIKLRVLQLDMIDLTSSMGKLVLTMLAAVAEMERNLIIERTVSGLNRTKSQGTVLGAKFKVSPTTLQQAHKWICEKVPHADVAYRIGVSSATLSALKKNWMCSNEKMEEYKQRYEAQQMQLKGKSYE